MKLLSVRCAAFLAALFACLAASAPSFAQAVPLITQPVDESQQAWAGTSRRDSAE